MLWFFAKLLIKCIPMDRLVAYGLNLMVKQLGNAKEDVGLLGEIERVILKIAQTVRVVEEVIADNVVTSDEVTNARLELLEIWANGTPSLEAEEKLRNLKKVG